MPTGGKAKRKITYLNRPIQTFSNMRRKVRKNRLSLNPLPFSRTVKLRYSDYATIDSAGTLTGASYRANGLYDPRTAVGGHQPALFDMMASLYNHYVVIGSRCQIDYWTEDAAGNYGVVVGIKLDDDNAFAGGGGGVQDIMELPNHNRRWKMLRMNSGGERTMTRVAINFSPKKFFGIKDVKDNRDQIGSVVTADPVEQAYFCPFVGHPDGATNIAVIHYIINISYIVNFSEPRDQQQN